MQTSISNEQYIKILEEKIEACDEFLSFYDVDTWVNSGGPDYYRAKLQQRWDLAAQLMEFGLVFRNGFLQNYSDR
jgi:hypothetical protein